MKNNIGVSTAYGLSGTQYNADADGIFIVRAADVRPLIAAGWAIQNNLESVAIFSDQLPVPTARR